MMIWLRILFLISALTLTSGYRFRCYLACTDQTSTQNDYTEQRDKCREYAQLKVDMAMRESGGMDDHSRKAHLVSLFSQCMGNNGWIVPDGKGEGPKTAAPAAQAAAPNTAPSQAITTAPPPAAVAAANKNEEKALITRASECAFARYSASVSSNAAARAQACDIECEHALRAAPGAPRPASCSPDVVPRLSKGNEK